MSKKSILILILFFFSGTLKANEWCIIISKSCTDINTTVSLQNIYLKKQRFLGSCSLTPLNFSAKDPIRQYFTKEVLKLSTNAWIRYYNEMHFKGIDPPHIVSSTQSMLKYLNHIDGSVGYLPSSLMSQSMLEKFTILLKFDDD